MIDHLQFEWFYSNDGTPMIRHYCRDKVDEYRPPPPWRFTGSGFEPSFHCQACGAHTIVGESDYRPGSHVAADLPA